MWAQFEQWWRARTGRERLLLRGAAILILAVLTPLWAYLAAGDFRADAAARLASAREVAAQVDRIAAAAQTRAAMPAGSLATRLQTLAQASGLAIARIEPRGEESARIAFEPADSLLLYRWMDQVGRGGDFIASSAIIRVANSDLVQAEFEVREAP
jgi:type II secretory pathway component PulM